MQKKFMMHKALEFYTGTGSDSVPSHIRAKAMGKCAFLHVCFYAFKKIIHLNIAK